MPAKRGSRQRKTRKTKDKVLQARIPEQLDDELRDRAEHLGLSVSTIVRNVLLNTFNLVEGVVSDTAQLGRAAQNKAAPQVNEEPEVVAWQEAVLNQNGVCDQCNTILAKGEIGAVGIPVQARPVLLCLPCLAALSKQTDQPSADK